MMIDVKIPKRRKCSATFDSSPGSITMSFQSRGIKLAIDFNKAQWEEFKETMDGVEFEDAHRGFC